MSATVYSRPFIRVRGLNGASDPVAVPDGFVYVIRQVCLYSDAGSEGNHAFLEHLGTGQTLFYASWVAEERSGRYFDGRITFFPSESFRMRSDSGVGGGVDVYVGGYQLRLP